MTASSEDFEAIRRYIRNICVHDQPRWESSWKLILENNETARRGLVHPDVFIRTLEANNIFFPRRIARALVEQFQAPNGGVQVAKFLKWIELSRPADHVDPELVFARLPQPYRRIVKILDKDILDASWELIKQQSARFKAETAAALAATARSNRDTIDSVADPDDYEGAKKRCCKIFDRKDLGGNHRVVRIAQHDTLPVVVAALEVDSSETPGHTPVVLQLFSTLTHEHIAEYTLPTTGNGEPSSPDLSFKRYKVTGLTPIRVRSVTQDGGRATLAFGIRVTEFTTVPASEEQPESSSCTKWIHVFEAAEVDIFALSIPGGGAVASESKGSFRMAATGKFEHLKWLEMSPDGRCVAFATVPGSISVFMMATNANAEERPLERSSDDTLAIDFNTATPLMKIDCGALQIGFGSVSRLHFAVKPTLKRTLPSSRSQPPGAYALVVCYSTRVTKYILSSSSSANAVPIASWDHLAEITSSTMDATTQFLAVGLADGAVVVWDTFEDAHHVYLSPSMTAVSESSSSHKNACDDPRIDAVVVYRNEFIVALSSSRQQVRFFDIRKRVAPQLHRIVTAPAPPTTLQQGEGVKLGSLVETVNVLDVPIAIIGYSNGTHMLYDLRTATAIGSIRCRSQANRGGPQTAVLACQHGVVAAQSSLLDFYDWYQLLLAGYPSFEHVLKQRDLKQDPISAKRLFLGSFAGPRIALSPEVAGTESIDKLLCRTAKISVSSSVPSLIASSSAILRQSSNSGPGLTASDSSGSVGSQSRPSASNPDEVPELPPLPEVLLQPSTRSMRERFGEYCRELDASVTKEKESRMHRRRKELIKALTTGAW